MAKQSRYAALENYNANTSETYAWMIYQVYRMWMDNLRYSFYLSTDTAGIAPVFDGFLSYDEAVEKTDGYIRDTFDRRVALDAEYSRGMDIIRKIMELSDVPKDARGDLRYGDREDETISRDRMDEEMKRIIEKYESGEDVSVLEIALKNAYAMYRGKRAMSDETLKAELFILSQVLATITDAPEMMKKILHVIPKLQADYMYEMNIKKDDRFQNLSREKAQELFFHEMGGLFTPFVSSSWHTDKTNDAREANCKGMGKSINRYLGQVETPEFEYLTPVFFSGPGAGKNSILEQMARSLQCPFHTINLPQTTSADYTLPSYNPKNKTVASTLTENMADIGMTINLTLGDEGFRLNVEGRTGADLLQDFLLHGRLSPQSKNFKRHPGTLVVLATNTDKDSKPGETSEVGQAIKDRCVFFYISNRMVKSGFPRYIRGKFGKHVESGTALYSLYEFMSSDDENLGAIPLLNKGDINIDSNWVDMQTPSPSGRPLTHIMETMCAQKYQVTLKTIEEQLRPVTGEAFVARFNMFHKVSSSIPSVSEMLSAAAGIPQTVSIAALDVLFSSGFDPEAGKFVVRPGDVSPESVYFMNGGKGVPENMVESFRNNPSNMFVDGNEKKHRITFSQLIESNIGKIEKNLKDGKSGIPKKKLEEALESQKKGLAFLKELDSVKISELVENGVNKIYCLKKPAGEGADSLSDEEAASLKKIMSRGMNDPMIQKLFADRIINSFETYVENRYINKKPLEKQKVKDYITLVCMCPFTNQKENMLSQMKNIIVTIPSETVKNGIMKYGIEAGGDNIMTGESIMKKRSGKGKESIIPACVPTVFFCELPVFSNASLFSKTFTRFSEMRDDVTLEDFSL